jgi:hypothetical protein
MDIPTVLSRIAPSDGDILLGMRYNYFGKGSVNNDNENGCPSAARGDGNEAFGPAWNLSTHNDPVCRRESGL